MFPSWLRNKCWQWPSRNIRWRGTRTEQKPLINQYKSDDSSLHAGCRLSRHWFSLECSHPSKGPFHTWGMLTCVSRLWVLFFWAAFGHSCCTCLLTCIFVRLDLFLGAFPFALLLVFYGSGLLPGNSLRDAALELHEMIAKEPQQPRVRSRNNE